MGNILKINFYRLLSFRDGRKFDGEFVDDKIHGKGTFMWGDGRIYVGAYKNDTKHGYGEFYWPDGRCFKGNWGSGKQNGEGVMFEKDGKAQKGFWKDGELVNTDMLNPGTDRDNTMQFQSSTNRRYNTSSDHRSGISADKLKRSDVSDLKDKCRRDMEIFDNFPSTNRRNF